MGTTVYSIVNALQQASKSHKKGSIMPKQAGYQFIRQAVSKKLKRDWKQIKEIHDNDGCPW